MIDPVIDVLIYLGIVIALGGVAFRFIAQPIWKEARKDKKESVKIADMENEEINTKNVGKYTAETVKKFIENARPALAEAIKLHAEQKQAGASPQALKPLEDRIRLLQLAIKYEKPAMILNDLATRPIIGKLAGKLVGLLGD